MEEVRILGIVIENRVTESSKLQECFTKYGCSIRTRIGLHQADEKICSRSGLVLLELVGDNNNWKNLISDLDNIDGINYNFMDFTL